MNIYFIDSDLMDSIHCSFSKVMNLVFLAPFFICQNALNTDRNYCKMPLCLCPLPSKKNWP